jgi:TusA-related sulfurtransferase
LSTHTPDRSGAVEATSNEVESHDIARLDLRGIKCPLNWAHAKVRLESMRRGEIIELVIDDPRGIADIPRAAEAEGYSIIEVTTEGSQCRLRIER